MISSAPTSPVSPTVKVRCLRSISWTMMRALFQPGAGVTKRGDSDQMTGKVLFLPFGRSFPAFEHRFPPFRRHFLARKHNGKARNVRFPPGRTSFLPFGLRFPAFRLRFPAGKPGGKAGEARFLPFGRRFPARKHNGKGRKVAAKPGNVCFRSGKSVFRAGKKVFQAGETPVPP